MIFTRIDVNQLTRLKLPGLQAQQAQCAEDYVHRIGRTGRAGASGLAVTLVSGSDARLVADIEKLLKLKIEIETLAYDAEPSPSSSSHTRSGGDSRRSSAQGSSSDYRPVHSSSSFGQGSNGRPERASSYGEHSGRRERGGFRPAVASRDPFFEKPYEAPAEGGEAAQWEAAGRAPANGRVVSSNIKSKRKVAALFRPSQDSSISS